MPNRNECQDGFRHRLAPFICRLQEYEWSYLRSDLAAGLTVSVVLIPQATAYAMLAGLPPVYGLYAQPCGAVCDSWPPAPLPS